ncbi:MAG: acid stress-induced BolA-like protein IbaG/YrbA [Brevundimonas sp.]|jgi:acid stress-induced BolA-like protein IbaG/YrbA|nr:BolA/IbaG family iron-sulfur metabolism protein [Candidatus Thioglobus sp.]|tara:strand:- start:18 stop:245 length:228 start_codon:yes stop_codon:yes gene_type:complete
MTLEEVQKKLELGIEQSEVTMEGDGCNCSAVIVSPIFEGLSLLQRQRAVLGVVKEEIKSGELHALSVKTFTPAER